MADSVFSQSSETERLLLPPERPGMRWWPWLGLAAAVLVGLLFKLAFTPPPEPRGQLDPAVGTKLTLLQLEPLTGDAQPLTEKDLRGKVTVMNFWGPWCGFCRVEFPHLVELEQHFRDQSKFQFLSISSNYDPQDERGLLESTQDFLKEQQAEFSTYRDPGAKTVMALIQAAKIEGFGFPATVLLDDGVIQAVWIGFQPGDETALRQAIEKTLARQP